MTSVGYLSPDVEPKFDGMMHAQETWHRLSHGTMAERLRRLADHLESNPKTDLVAIRLYAGPFGDDEETDLQFQLEYEYIVP